MADCLFCKIVGKEIPATVIFESDTVLGFKDVNPAAPEHVLFIPKEHISTVLDIPVGSPVMSDLTDAANVYAREQGLDEEGFRLAVNCNAHGGQTVYHLHVHLLGGRPMTWPPG